MQLLKTLFLLILFLLRVYNGHNTYSFEVYQYSDSQGHPDSLSFFTNDSPINIGQLTYYNNFINTSIDISKKNKQYYHTVKQSNKFLPICLLLCGDIHLCPGPFADSDSSSKFSNDFKVFNKRGLHFIHINTRSLLSKLDDVRLITRRFNAACLCITETWLDDTVPDAEVHIENYSIQRKDRHRHGGGVCIYIRQDLSYNERSHLNHECLEATWIEIFLPKTKPILCASIYRPPKQSDFNNILDGVCSSCIHFTELGTILLGDFNTNVLSMKSCPLFKALKSFIVMFDFKQLISEYTRICNTSSTAIDLILVSDSERISQSGVIYTSFSDHCMLFFVRVK